MPNIIAVSPFDVAWLQGTCVKTLVGTEMTDRLYPFQLERYGLPDVR